MSAPHDPSPGLWAFHAKPLPDELLSSWFVRLAHGHGLKVQTFAQVLFGANRQVWNRDIDRLGPEWLLTALSRHTGTPEEQAFRTCLRSYEGLLFETVRESYVQRWILPIKIYHRKRLGFGLQFCPECLAEDRVPYFRKRWRVAFNTYCPTHGILLHDRCPACGNPVAFHRRELGKPDDADGGPVTQCFNCDFDLRGAARVAPTFYEGSAHQALEVAILRLEGRGPFCRPRSVGYYNVLRQLCSQVTHRYRNLKLKDYVEASVGAQPLEMPPARTMFETLAVGERHHFIQLATWLLADFERRITDAWYARAVTYSALLRDFEGNRPAWFDQTVVRFSDWRGELLPSRHGSVRHRWHMPATAERPY
ncbi:MAG: TniQ family protein [Acidobacteriia bacterium]|nr:TniQ family protein [Terriglobia bacterium]